MIKSRFSFKLRRAAHADGPFGAGASGTSRGKKRAASARSLGFILIGLAGFLAWHSNGFRAEKDLSRYPEIQLAYTTCKFERIAHYKGSTTRQIVFLTENGRYVMEDGVWGRHFDGPALANALAAGARVRAWLHPQYPHTLRGVIGGKVDVPPEWGLEY